MDGWMDGYYVSVAPDEMHQTNPENTKDET
jgi:hypothetical protein